MIDRLNPPAPQSNLLCVSMCFRMRENLSGPAPLQNETSIYGEQKTT